MIRSVPGRTPRVHPGAWVDPSAQVIGDVTIDEGASVWPLTVLRGDQDNYVTLGRNSNVQDNSVLHVTPEFPCIVGDFVTIGHRAVVHACRVMNNVRIVMGVPAKPIRKMDRAELDDILKNARDYIELWHRDYR